MATNSDLIDLAAASAPIADRRQTVGQDVARGPFQLVDPVSPGSVISLTARRLTKLAPDCLEPIGELQVADRAQGIRDDVEFGRGDDQVDLVSINIESRLGIAIVRLLTGHGELEHRAGQCERG